MRRLFRWILGAVVVLLGRRGGAEDPEVTRRRRERRRREPAQPRELEAPGSRNAETLVALLLLLAGVCGAGFVVFYFAYPDTQLFGLMLGLCVCFIGGALALASKKVVVQETAVEEREEFGDEETRRENLELLADVKRGVSRRKLLTAAAGAAGTGLGAAAVMPLASLGPNVDELLAESPWEAGRHVVDENGRRVRVDDLAVGSFLTAFPEAASKDRIDTPIVLVRLPEEELQLPAERQDWHEAGVVAYSKTCTHAGCAVSMFRYPLYEPATPHGPALVCPCHFSTFDVARAAKVLFGPAGRPLPQLPLERDAAGYLVAAGPLSGPVGPSYPRVRMQEGQ